ncbi:quinolinate synthase NadA [bacterium]|nr:quinolinate synthase NadA [bacterium]
MELSDYKQLSDEDLKERIVLLKREKNAVILVHNYQRDEIQDLADYLGDSFGLSVTASKTDADLIVFCGVDFMAESAKILNPGKKVVIPDIKADCPMAHMVELESLRNLKRENPDAIVVTYVNSTAEVKAESDICCTSANAVEVVKSLNGHRIIFTPDANLAEYTRRLTGADIIPWEGFCYVHDAFGAIDVEQALSEHPGAYFIAHPECRWEVLQKADYITSTSGMIRWVNEHLDVIDRRGVIIGTEVGLIRQLQRKYPGRKIFPLFDRAICRTQKLTTLPKLCWSLEHEQYEIILDEDTIRKAENSLKRMLEVTPEE